MLLNPENEGLNGNRFHSIVLIGSSTLLIGFAALPARLVPRHLRYLGKISYGLYVFHWTNLVIAADLLAHTRAWTGLTLNPYLFTLAEALIAFVMTIGIAALSYRFYEKPFIDLKKRFTFIRSRD